MTAISRARSLLFVPGTRPERFAKAAGAGADGIICDLEDAVAPADKDTARESVRAGLEQLPALVRVNAAGTPWYAEDVQALADAPGLLGVMLPKSELPDQVAELAARLAGVPLVLLIESALGIDNAGALARVHGVARLCFGNLDFALDAGITVRADDEDELLYARSRLVVAARAAGLPGPIDGVVPEFDDDDLLRNRTRRAVDLGFAGKLAIHPRQVAVINAAFTPSADEVAWARRVVEAAGSADGAAVRVDGKMVDRPILLRAESILAHAPNE